MRRCAFLTLGEGSAKKDDELAYAPLAEAGWRVDAVGWRRPEVDWGAYDVVVIRSPWDYQRHPERFLEVLEEIDGSRAELENPLALVRWNISKTYLLELATLGVSVVPTWWRPHLGPGDLVSLLSEMGSDEVVVKPVISASAEGAFRLAQAAPAERVEEIESYFSKLPLLAQPLARAVLDEGEYSLFFFDGDYSHAVLKTPGPGDFRVQEELGGQSREIRPDEALLQAARTALAVLDEVPLYARVDIVRSDDGSTYWLMELELIEPVLYLGMDPAAPERFARALVARAGRRGRGETSAG